MALRELPCPYRIIDDFGGAFSMGCFGGCIAYFFRGMWFSPKKERLFGGVMHLKRRAPLLGGSFALWGGIFSSTECLLIHLRNKEDALNGMIAGFMAGGLLAIRSGKRVALRNAVVGGTILGCIQLVEVGMIKYRKQMELKYQHQAQQDQIDKQMQMLKSLRN